jgi:hypothetical protein
MDGLAWIVSSTVAVYTTPPPFWRYVRVTKEEYKLLRCVISFVGTIHIPFLLTYLSQISSIVGWRLDTLSCSALRLSWSIARLPDKLTDAKAAIDEIAVVSGASVSGFSPHFDNPIDSNEVRARAEQAECHISPAVPEHFRTSTSLCQLPLLSLNGWLELSSVSTCTTTMDASTTMWSPVVGRSVEMV